MEQLAEVFKGKRIFLTGHTGFKGSWLLQILHAWGADVKGFSLAPEQDIDLFNQIDGAALCYASVLGDINDYNLLHGELVRFQPDYVFHLAAQALVRRSYYKTIDTFATNVMGTAHVLEAIKHLQKPCVAVMVTTDKVYENPEDGHAFLEDDKLGGHDPYSASKAASEIVIASYRKSFFSGKGQSEMIAVASARAGNVIGGGDYSEDRLIPDIIRSIRRQEPLVLRNPESVRPWQHVLDPLSGYLQLAAALQQQPHKFNSAYNFGPEVSDVLTVKEVANTLMRQLNQPSTIKFAEDAQPLHEAKLLQLDAGKAKQDLRWQPKLNSKEALAWTASWYADQQASAREKCEAQIKEYFSRG